LGLTPIIQIGWHAHSWINFFNWLVSLGHMPSRGEFHPSQTM
jgi:hypothetical protein